LGKKGNRYMIQLSLVTIVHISVTALSPLGNICVIYLTSGVWPVPVAQALGQDGIPSHGRPGSNRFCALCGQAVCCFLTKYHECGIPKACQATCIKLSSSFQVVRGIFIALVNLLAPSLV